MLRPRFIRAGVESTISKAVVALACGMASTSHLFQDTLSAHLLPFSFEGHEPDEPIRTAFFLHVRLHRAMVVDAKLAPAGSSRDRRTILINRIAQVKEMSSWPIEVPEA